MSTRVSLPCIVFFVGFFGVATAVRAQGIPCSYTVAHVIQAPPGPFSASPTIATAISPNGRWVVGYSLFNGSGNPRPFVYDTQTSEFSPVALPSWLLEASPADVNDNRIMVGTGASAIAGQRGFVCDLNSGTWTELLPQNPPIGWSGATGINSANVISGWRSIDDGGDPVNPRTAFIFRDSVGFTDLGLIQGMSSSATDIADDGQVTVVQGVGLAGFFWTGRRLTNLGWLPGADDIRLWDAQAGGRAAGGCLFIAGTSFWVVPFVYQDEALRPLPSLSPALPSCTASAMNSAGLVVGHCRPINNGDPMHAVSWLGDAVRALQPMLIDAGNIQLRSADALASDGRIVANATMNGSSFAVILSPQMGLPGDTNCDRVVNIDDLLAVVGSWGPGASYGDLNADQVVNITDLLIVIDEWTL